MDKQRQDFLLVRHIPNYFAHSPKIVIVYDWNHYPPICNAVLKAAATQKPNLSNSFMHSE
jgi:hypothetical protein